MKKIILDKIASSTRNVNIAKEVTLSDKIKPEEGNVIAVKALGEKVVYNELELIDGRMAKICEGDIIAGVLGNRKALRGYIGEVPKKVRVGDTLQILNLGGVIGKCTSENPTLGPPISVEVLGSILTFPSMDSRIGIPANMKQGAIETKEKLEHSVPLIMVSGTCMDSGKTLAACEIIKILNRNNYRIGATKLTGVSLMRDILKMEDYGAVKIVDFTDAGIASTSPAESVKVAKGLLSYMNNNDLDAIVVELGDGILGGYGAQRILNDKEIMSFVKTHVVCAMDPVAALGACLEFEKRYKTKIDVIAGPATDNYVGVKYIEDVLGVSAINARTDSTKLGKAVKKLVFGKK